MKAFAARPRDAEDIRHLVQVLGLHDVRTYRGRGARAAGR